MSSKPPSQRQLKVGEELRHVLSSIFMTEDIYDPETLEHVRVTVSEVRISPDLHNATVFVMPLAGKKQDQVLEALKANAPQFRKLLASRITLRHVPALHFVLDSVYDQASSLEELLQRPEVQRDIKLQSNN